MYFCRPIETQDYPIICTFPQSVEELFFVYPQAIYPLSIDQLEATVKSRLNPTVVINEEGLPVGFANLYNIEEEVGCSLGNVIVSPDYRGKGAAAFLIQTMIQIAKNEMKVPRLRLTTHNTNLLGLLFYNKVGFKPFDLGVMKDKS